MSNFSSFYSPQPTEGPGAGGFAGFNGGQNSGGFGTFNLGSGGLSNLGGGGGTPGGLFSQIGNVLGSEGFQTGLGAFSTLADIYTGFKSLGLAKDQLGFQKKAFNKNFNASAKAYNNALKDKWAANNASAEARGNNFVGMDKWLSGRTVAPTGGK